MDELDKEEIRKIAYNCKKATFLIEKRQLEKITIREELELKIHLAGCSVCRIFQQQSIIINQMVKSWINSSPQEKKLDENYKNQLQNIIQNRIKKN